MKSETKLKHFLSLPYRIEIIPIPADEGGGYEAFIPDLGRWTMTGEGDSPEEALRSLQTIKEELFRTWLEEGKEIPLPKPASYPRAV